MSNGISFSTSSFEAVWRAADLDGDGRLTKREYSQFKNGARSNDTQLFDDEFSSKTGHRTLNAITQILDRNFNQIAFRALRKGEIRPTHDRPTDSTIELRDIQKLANFDGEGTQVSIRDIGRLVGGNINNWPQLF